jgi:cobyric acid synthase CobQ/L-threonine-O-3-phosphate decarboxylase
VGRDRGDIVDFSASINPLGPPEGLRPVLVRAMDRLVHYPDPDAAGLVELLARHCGVTPEQVVAGNGSTELLFALARGCEFERALIPVPSYADYAAAIETAGRPVEFLPLEEAADFALDWPRLLAALRPRDLVVLGQPNNPSGRLLDNEALLAAAASHPQATFVVDEAFAGFVQEYRSLCDKGDSPIFAETKIGTVPLPANVIVVRSLTKFYAVPGLRLGYAVASPAAAERIRRHIPPWSVNVFAQEAAACLLADEAFARQTVAFVGQQRAWLARELAGLPGLRVYPSAANFLLVRLEQGSPSAARLAEKLLAEGIAIRTFDASQHLDGRYFRVAVRTRRENERLLATMGRLLHREDNLRTGGTSLSAAKGVVCGPSTPFVPQGVPPIIRNARLPRRRAAALMIQGTSSSAGKSVLTAALGRILLEDGLRVAPFKAQNMSLNSFVTRDGGEMGRAQVVQAQACRIEPDVRMNPVLLKPNSDTGCQVIVRGKPVGNMQVGEYIEYKPQAWAAASECYDELAAGFDVILLEGAGSPGEVNLKHHDIVNMRMARHAEAPVLIVGDIDRGGVFASLVGTLEVLDPWERELVAGWIINRFRGDESLLGPALEYMLRRTGRPVLGVVPYLDGLHLPQEDSVEFKAGEGRLRLRTNSQSPMEATSGSQDHPLPTVEIAVIDLPHIANFTDFDALGVEGDVRLRIVRSPAELDHPDAVILPGSKNTLGDLDYLRRSGLAERVRTLAQDGGTEVVGICGGFQMLGREIRDPLGVESDRQAAVGLGLLEVRTELAAEKTLLRTSAVHAPSGLEVAGYEIHHGQTSCDGSRAVLSRPDGQCVGAASPALPVWGTYLHGVFDADAFRRWFIDRLRVRRGLAPLGRVVARYDIQATLDRLAAAVRRSLRMDEIYRLLRLP